MAIFLILVAGPAGILAFPAATRHCPPQPAESQPSSAALTTRPATTDEQREQMLREAFELINDDDLPAALRALQRAVAAADVPALAALSDLTRRSRGISLAELIAQTRLREATSAYHAHRGFRLRIVTPVERDALVALLQSAEGELRARRFDGRTLVDWAAAPEQYAGLTDASRSLVDDAGLLAAILAARLEHDSDLERPSPARRDAAETRVQLMRLAAGVAALPGFTDPRPPQPASAPASAASRP